MGHACGGGCGVRRHGAHAAKSSLEHRRFQGKLASILPSRGLLAAAERQVRRFAAAEGLRLAARDPARSKANAVSFQTAIGSTRFRAKAGTPEPCLVSRTMSWELGRTPRTDSKHDVAVALAGGRRHPAGVI